MFYYQNMRFIPKVFPYMEIFYTFWPFTEYFLRHIALRHSLYCLPKDIFVLRHLVSVLPHRGHLLTVGNDHFFCRCFLALGDWSSGVSTVSWILAFWCFFVLVFDITISWLFLIMSSDSTRADRSALNLFIFFLFPFGSLNYIYVTKVKYAG